MISSQEIFKKAIQVALKSQHKYKIGCLILNSKGDIISEGFNIKKTHPLQAKFATKAKQPLRIYLHAEIHSLVKCWSKPHTAVIVRVDHLGRFRPSAPCPICRLAFRESGLKDIVYKDHNNEWKREFL